MKSYKNKQRKVHVKIGEKVLVLSGNQKGFVGSVKSISKKTCMTTLVELAPRIKYLKSSQTEEAKKIEIPLSIHSSNLMAWDEKANLASRKGWKIVDSVKKQYYKKSSNLIE